MNQKVNLQKMIPLFVLLSFVAAIGLLGPRLSNLQGVELSSLFSSNSGGDTQFETVDATKAADNSAARWIAMARFYKEQDMLTRDPFDYGQAAENQAARWQAMAEAYERYGLLNYHSNPDDLSAYRWLAMAKGYESMGLLNDKVDPNDASAFRWQAMAKAYEKMGMLTR